MDSLLYIGTVLDISFFMGMTWTFLGLCVLMAIKALIGSRKRAGKCTWRPSRVNAKSGKQYYLFFDTETTGLPKDYDAPAADDDNWPRLVQLSWIVAEKDGIIVKKEDHIIKPSGFSIPLDAVAVHGITTEQAQREGDNLSYVLNLFARDCSAACLCAGHNVQFDKRVIGSEFLRLGRRDAVQYVPAADTMKSTKYYCKIEGRDGRYKMPTLQELYRHLFGRNFSGAHDSMSDVKATMECFFELVKRGVIVVS